MNQRVKSISLGFENCEDISIDKECIHMLLFDKVAECIYYDHPRDTIRRYQTCEEFLLELNEKADRQYEYFGYSSEQTIFQRTQLCQDITSVEIIYDDDTKELIYVPYMPLGGGESNAYQTSCIRDTGRMLICISKDKTANTFE